MKKLLKPVAVLLCLGAILLAVPNQNFAAKKGTYSSFTALINQPVQFITSLFPFLNPIFVSGSNDYIAKAKNPIGRVRPTGDIDIGRPGSGN